MIISILILYRKRESKKEESQQFTFEECSNTFVNKNTTNIEYHKIKFTPFNITVPTK